MKKKPAKAVVVPGGVMRRPAPQRASAPKPVVIIPGGVMRPVPAKKSAAKKKTVKRKLALGESVACCAAEALAASLRLTGWPVSDRDVLALYELTAGGPDEGATISATLEGARRFGLAGRRPAGVTEVREPGAARPCSWGEQEMELRAFQLGEPDGPDVAAAALDGDEISLVAGLDGHGGDARGVASAVLAGFPVRGCLPCHGPSIILGVDLPDGPHALCGDGAVWWSWGEPYDPAAFPGAVIGEAWQVTWLS